MYPIHGPNLSATSSSTWKRVWDTVSAETFPGIPCQSQMYRWSHGVMESWRSSAITTVTKCTYLGRCKCTVKTKPRCPDLAADVIAICILYLVQFPLTRSRILTPPHCSHSSFLFGGKVVEPWKPTFKQQRYLYRKTSGRYTYTDYTPETRHHDGSIHQPTGSISNSHP